MAKTEAPAPTTARVRKSYDFRPGEVFDAWLDVDTVRRFMCPSPGHVSHAELDPRVGGSYRIDMTIGEDTYSHTGEYLEISRPTRLVFTWSSPATQGRSTEVTLDFLETDGGTDLVLTHTGLPSEELAQNHEQGWSSILDRLADALA